MRTEKSPTRTAWSAPSSSCNSAEPPFKSFSWRASGGGGTGAPFFLISLLLARLARMWVAPRLLVQEMAWRGWENAARPAAGGQRLGLLTRAVWRWATAPHKSASPSDDTIGCTRAGRANAADRRRFQGPKRIFYSGGREIPPGGQAELEGGRPTVSNCRRTWLVQC